MVTASKDAVIGPFVPRKHQRGPSVVQYRRAEEGSKQD